MGDSGLIHGRSRSIDRIGRGGMGEVRRARDESPGRQAAVKCLEPGGPQQDRSSGRVLRERFRREARVAAAPQHRGTTVVHDFGESEGVPHLVREPLRGRDLSRPPEDDAQHPLPVEEVVEIAERVAEARIRTLGADHAGTLAARDDEAHRPERLGRGAEAAEPYRRAAAPRQRPAGPETPARVRPVRTGVCYEEP
ncbi:hypothetical protein ADK41_19720 [Streptomyces caelestis]|uniref:Protein kinase domain-containing protein n=1 Tax=Streptomyces caelestis TaxID=36816 RepID=A0A0M8QKD4_9ACTN|nr:hypothetical protein ADK41_19720 [Streptomyces caelestis]